MLLSGWQEGKERLKDKKLRKFLYVLSGLAVVAAGIAFYMNVLRQSETDVLITIDGENVTREEYQLVLSSFQAQVQSSYATEEANRKDFWSDTKGKDSPLSRIMDLTLQKLKENKGMVSLAKEKNLNVDMDYLHLKNEYTADADTREDRKSQAVYGPDSLSFSSYYEYRYTSLQAQLEEVLKSEFEVTDDMLRNWYKERQEEYTYQTQVCVQVCEMNTETANAYGIDTVKKAMESSSQDELKQKFPDAGIYQITMNDLDTQEGKSGVYASRLQTACQLQQGQISEPIQIEKNVLVMKCISRQENGSLDFESVKGLLESQYQTTMAQQAIEDKIKTVKANYKEKNIKAAALEILEN